MKYVIVGIYDAGYGFSVCKNGKSYSGYTIRGKQSLDCKAYNELNWKGFLKYLKTKYEDYDLILVCNDADIIVVKEKKENGTIH